MRESELSRAQLRAYLDVLGEPRAAPSMRALRGLVLAQATRVPFENLSKLLLRRRGVADVPAIGAYLAGIRRSHLGGTCYPNAFHFHALLRALGYDADLCGAAMRSGEDVHAAIVARVEGRELLVDVGYGAPFLEPLPLDAERDVVVARGPDRYLLRPRDLDGRSRLDLVRGGELRHGYLLNPTPRSTEHFRAVVERSFADDATFMNAVVVIRHTVDASVALHNLSLLRTTRETWSEEVLPDRAALVAAVETEFGIPAAITREAIAALGALGDVYA